MTSANFEFIKALVYQSSGIVLGLHKKEMVYSRLSRRLRVLKLSDFDQYCDYLSNHKPEEFSHFINAITTNLTSFFRERHHFDFLKSTLIPRILSRSNNNKRIRIWSAGCSSGEEAYSIAMTLAPNFPTQKWDFKILATDLDSNMLAKAKTAVYSEQALQGIDPQQIRQGFNLNKRTKQYKVKPDIQNLVHFRRLNLLENWPMRGTFDAIFCRNVVIYFDNQTKNNLIRRYAQLLEPHGYLFLGHSETLSREISEFNPLGHTIYQRKE
ncbi:protein-glutamate O-methyltransferase CheR [Catenovulum sp. 2E275]|uniref:CheR family methyltransferase n=1 Tax=Catenovulum sp. 2E275 TaxID=2980497 RepID=UPI0021D0DEAC|nr:protein-glutamate O-methyltransferase CheR [Catenovulum sp. 2E275]MCU4675511.1 protein-glutamate O-methyltransferase CheR [Catenovulum sp. 2E275]